MREGAEGGHVVLSAVETTRPIQGSAIAAVAQLFALGEGSAHALLQPAATGGPIRTHALDAKDHLGYLAVAGADFAPIEGNDRIAKQQAITRAVQPGAGGSEKYIQGGEVGSEHCRGWKAGNQESGSHWREACARAMQPQRQSPIGVTKDDVLMLSGPEDEACLASKTRQSQIGHYAGG